MRWLDRSPYMRRVFLPSSIWALFKVAHFDGDRYESVVSAQDDVTSPSISIYEPADQDNDDKAFDYEDVVNLIKDGVIQNLIPYSKTERKIGISRNDEQALKDLLEDVRRAWGKCLDRLETNRIAETNTIAYRIED